MGELDDFLSLPDVSEIEAEVEVSKRLGKFKVKAMSQEEYTGYQNRCRSKIKKGGMDFNLGKFNLLIVIGQTVYPNLKSEDLLRKANCNTAEEFVTKKLLPGEIITLASKIQEISGFDTDINEDVEEAKNL